MPSYRLSVFFTLFLVTPVLAADQAAQRDPFDLPAGYSNEHTATDPKRPHPASTPGELQSYSTLHSLGFEWDLGASDTDHDATCRVAYRRADETDWHDALPLFRVDYAGWYADKKAKATYNMFAGSILFLRPGAEYLVRLTLSDPDGGSAEREVKIATRAIPSFGVPTRTLHVTPRTPDDMSPSGDGSAKNPFRGIAEADRAAKPGDLMLLHSGDYGAVTLSRSGEASENKVGALPRYIVWKAAGDGVAQCHRMYVDASSVWIEGVTFQRAEEPTGLRGADRSADNVIRANTFRGYSYSVRLSNSSRSWYLADNDIIGDGTTGIGGEGIELNQSPDHTVCYNRISKTADGTSYPLRNCDIFANDVFDVSDDGVEPDYGYANIRIWGNRLDAPAGITFQAMYCGPWYIVRNQVVSSTNVFKLRVQDRYLVANNTFIGYGPAGGAKVPHAHGLLTAFSRNNLWIHGGGSPFLWVCQVPVADTTRDYMRRHVLFSTLRADWRTDVDYDGFDWSSASPGKQKVPTPFVWNGARLENLAMLAEKVGIEKHGRVIDKETIFSNYTPPPYDFAARPRLTLRPASDAVDAGVTLPNIVEEFAGKSPDLGAWEASSPLSHLGPRSQENWRDQHEDWILKHQRGR